MTELTAITDEDTWLEKRKEYITSTQSPALFGLEMSMAATAFELWHIKNGLIDDAFKANNYMQWGRIFESSIVEVIKEDNPDWNINPMKVFAYDDNDKIGSSFDNILIHPEKGNCLLEIKMTSYGKFKQQYIEDDESEFIESPDYYEVQCQHELECIDKYDNILLAVALVDTREIKYLWRERDREMGAAIRKKIKEFWAMKDPPDPDLVKDSDILARMHRANSRDEAYDGTENSAFEMASLAYLDESFREKQAKEAKKKARSEMILAMGDCNTAWSNCARVANKKSFRVTATKEK